MKTKLISKILGVGVAGSMAIALAGTALVASPVAADTTKWTKYNTPSWEDGVILPGNNILDYDISGDDGNTIYVVAEVNRACVDDNPFLADIDTDDISGGVDNDYGLFKSTDGGVTWKDITQNVIDSKNLPGLDTINYVAVAPDDEDWVAVTGYYSEKSPVTVASKDGGDNFAYAGDMKDTGADTEMELVYDTEVSPELDGIHVIAACGVNSEGEGTVYRLNAGTWLTGSWEDTAYYDGWDGDANGNVGGNTGIYSTAIIDGEFSPNFDIDFTFVIIGVAHKDNTYGSDGYLPFVQTGDFDSKQWGAEASLPDPVQIKNNSDTLVTVPGIWLAGIALPADYDGSDSSSRIVFGYVDALNWTTKKVGGFVFRIDGGDVSPQVAPSGAPVLASIAVNGNADTGKMMIGELVKIDNSKAPGAQGFIVLPDACVGVRVWHTEELDICCPKWELCCKCPSGTYAARVVYTPDGSKEYATTTSSDADHMFDDINPAEDFYIVGWGTPGDETAFSVSLDDGTSWNQIGLIDTDISYLSDVTVCPDCSVVYLSTVNGDGEGIDDCGMSAVFSCDSVWRTLDDGDTWERIFHGAWSDTTGQRLELRLPCENTEDCCDYTDPSAPGGTIYLGVQNTNDMWYSRDCGQCWTKTQQTKITIQDFAVDTESTVYVLASDGKVSKSTNFGRRWSDAKDTKAGSGHMITVCCGQGLVVVGPQNGDDKVAWSDDGGDSWNQTDKLPGSDDDGVHVACATTCENIIYAAFDSSTDGVGAVYRGDLTDGSWTDMNAMAINYTGIGVGRSDGTLYVLSDEIRADTSKGCSDRFDESYTTTYSGVARNLTPCETACCGTEDWDYLICGIDGRDTTLTGPNRDRDYTDFDAQPNGLDLCGCLSASTNTILWAIDRNADQGYYQVSDGKDGSLWTYEDCASKTGPTLVSPADGSVLDCMACAGCGAQPFTLKWNRMCNSCSYDIEIMDDQGNVVITITDEKITGTTPTYYLNSSDGVSAGELTCGSTYQWHVREADTDCECIHSPWSATWTFTVATSSLNGVQLISPKMAANDIGTSNIGFSWTSVPEATSYSLVVSPNANLSGALVSQEISTTAYNYAGPLDYSKTYYWQVKAWKDTALLSTSSVGVFTIAPKPVAPQPPVVVETTPAPTINIPPAQQITPAWIYAIIGIGAALAVVVIVLIVRTRRP